MDAVRIRKYDPEEDEEAVRELFTVVMSELVPSGFVHILKQPLTQMVLMCLFCALLTSSRSFLLPVLAVTLLLAGVRQLACHVTKRYIEYCLGSDLGHVPETYLAGKDSCFWVAEVDGSVVGMVACVPAQGAPGGAGAGAPGCMQLKRMSVRRYQRHMGVGRALLGTVVAFARERGFPAVVLRTSVLMTDAQRLYRRAGFVQTRGVPVAHFLAKVLNYTLLEYQLDVTQQDPHGD